MKGFKMIFIISTLLLLTSFSASSQIDTARNKVILTQQQSVKAVKDLVTYDGLKEIVKIMESQMVDLREILKQKDAIISSHERTHLKNEQIIANDQAIYKAQEQQYNDLNKKYKRSVRAGRFKVVLLPVAIAGGIYLGYKLF